MTQRRGTRAPYEKHLKRPASDLEVAFEWQPRDYEILVSVLDHRFLTGELLQYLFPPDRASQAKDGGRLSPHSGSNLERRLRKLFRAGYLDRLRPVRAGVLVYTLSDKGAKLLRDGQPELPLSEPASRRLKSYVQEEQLKPDTNRRKGNLQLSFQYIEHALMVSRFRVALTVATRTAKHYEILTSERASANTRVTWMHNRREVTIDPDAFCILGKTNAKGQRLAFFIEADRSTMPHGRMLTKYLNYYYLYADSQHQMNYGIKSFRVLTITKSRARAEGLASLIAGREPYMDFLQRLWPNKKLTKEQRKVAEALLTRARDIKSGRRRGEPDHRNFFAFASEEEFLEHPEHVLSSIWITGKEPTKQTALIQEPLKKRT